MLSSSWTLVDGCDGPLISIITLFLHFVLVVPRIPAFFKCTTFSSLYSWDSYPAACSTFCISRPIFPIQPACPCTLPSWMPCHTGSEQSPPSTFDQHGQCRSWYHWCNGNKHYTHKEKFLSSHVVLLFGIILALPLQPYSIVQQCNSQINMEVVAGWLELQILLPFRIANVFPRQETHHNIFSVNRPFQPLAEDPNLIPICPN